MRISDWSSDVCSSDLAGGVSGGELRELVEGVLDGDIAREGDRFLSHDREGAGSGKVAANQAGSGNDDGILRGSGVGDVGRFDAVRSEEHTSELQSLMRISYAVFCLKKKKKIVKPIHIDITNNI